MNALSSSISLLLIVWLVLFLYEDYRVDSLRQDLFGLRGRLFDEANNGNIDFNCNSYRATRAMINGMIRFGHRISFTKFFLMAIIFQSRDSDYAGRKFRELILSGTDAEIKLVESYIKEANDLIIKHLVSSPIFVATAIIPVVIYFATKAGFNVYQKINKKMGAFDSAAHCEGNFYAVN